MTLRVNLFIHGLGWNRNMNKAKVTYPINLLLNDHNCLVVGGGSVAWRKTSGLLAAGALVTVVAVRMDSKFLSLAEKSKVTLCQRSYQPHDVESMTLVFAATDDPEINAAVVADCRKKRILCCAVDHHWPAGDFITPASFHHEGVTVSISTGGRACRDARKIREMLEKQLQRGSEKSEDFQE